MKKILLAIGLLALLSGCKKTVSCSEKGFYSGNNNYLQMLQVSYVNPTLMGGRSFVFGSSNHSNLTIPFGMSYHAPSDFGDITFTHAPTGDTVFNATIVWNGCGHINIPAPLDQPSTFCTQSEAVACPDSSRFEILDPFDRYANAPVNYASIWSAINHLGITSYMVQQNCKIGLYQYTPSVGIGDPNQWSWIVFLYK